jgi:hypothetical protein
MAAQEGATNDMDRDHKQRMLDLEFAQEQKLKAMELKFKEQEYQIKADALKHKSDQAKKKTQVRDQDKSRHRDAATTSKKEMEGK